VRHKILAQGTRPPPRGGESHRNVSQRVAWLTFCLVIASLCGCSAGSFVPDGPHLVAPQRLQALIRSASSANAVDPKLVAAVIDAESHGDSSAVSRVGAEGLMQLMPDTWMQYGVGNPFDPVANIDGGTRYLHDLVQRYRGNVKLAVAAYNAGPGAVDAAHGIPPFAETKAYVGRVLAALR
jgi:soluble lytic murein transglycosylase-like protein